MYTVKIVDHLHAVVEVTLEGLMSPEEVRQGQDDLRRLLVNLRGRRFKILVDVRRLRPMAPELADASDRHAGVRARRRARAHRPGRRERRRGAPADPHEPLKPAPCPKTRSFKDRDQALDWLVRGDAAL